MLLKITRINFLSLIKTFAQKLEIILEYNPKLKVPFASHLATTIIEMAHFQISC